MARAITKIFGSTTTSVIAKYMSEDGKITEKRFTANGKKSENAMKITVRKELGTTNFYMVPDSLTYTEGSDEKQYSMSADAFVAHAKPCEDGISYGREFVTATVKTTEYVIFGDGGEKHVILDGTPAESRARKSIADVIGSDNFMICGSSVAEMRLYMTKADFCELAICKNRDETEDEN